jgi:perosamine synthetase
VNVHYIPVHLHPFYRDKFATSEGLCPIAEDAYKRILSLPMFPGLKDSEVDFVSETLYSCMEK